MPESINPYDAPQSEVIEQVEQASLLIFKRFSAWFVFLLNLFSLGIYGYIWLFIRSRTINSYTLDKIPELLIYSVIGLYIAGTAIDFAPFWLDVPPQLVEFNYWLNYFVLIIYIVWNFSLRSRLTVLLSDKKTAGLHISGFLTFLFGSIYLQYKINEGLEVLNEERLEVEDVPPKSNVTDEELMVDGIDYSKYSKSELQDCLMNIDSETYANRARVVKLAYERF